jgi:hypothetical protein
MKTRYTFQTLILLALAPVLAGMTAIWAWQLYHTTEQVILQGFDRKLLAVSGSTAALVDGDEHEGYQRRQAVVALAAGPAGLLGWVEGSGLATVNPATGGARVLGAAAEGAVRGLVWLPAGAQLLALTGDGQALVELEPATGRRLRTVPLSRPLDGIFGDSAGCAGWSGNRLWRVDPADGAVTATDAPWPEPPRAATWDASTGRVFALTRDGTALIVLDRPGGPPRRVALAAAPPAAESAAGVQAPPPPMAAIAWSGGRLLAAGASLLEIDPASGFVSNREFTTGYFDVADPFYRTLRGVFVQLQRDAGLTYLYTQIYEGDRKLYYVMDGTTSSEYSRPGTPDEVPAAMVETAERVQFLGQHQVSGIQPWEPWGLVKSGFAPIRNTAGKIVAMAGADVDISVIRAKSRGALFAAIFIGVGSVLAAGFVSYRVARALTRPLQQLKETALWIAAGHYGAELKSTGTRELSVLADRLDELRRRLAAEGDRVYQWQDEIRGRRAQTALAHTLSDQAADPGVRADEALSSHVRGADFVTWLEAPALPAVDAACVRVEAGRLASELLRSGRTAAEVPALLLDSTRELIASVGWHEAAGRLHFRARSAVTVEIDGVERILEGTDSVALPHRPRVRWSAAAAQKGRR